MTSNTNQQELEAVRTSVGKVLKFWRKKEMSELYYPLDEIMERFAAEQDRLIKDIEARLPKNRPDHKLSSTNFNQAIDQVRELLSEYREPS